MRFFDLLWTKKGQTKLGRTKVTKFLMVTKMWTNEHFVGQGICKRYNTCTLCKLIDINKKLSCFLACNCFIGGSISAECDRYGHCKCKPKYHGRKCNRCVKNHWGFPDCRGLVKSTLLFLKIFVNFCQNTCFSVLFQSLYFI